MKAKLQLAALLLAGAASGAHAGSAGPHAFSPNANSAIAALLDSFTPDGRVPSVTDFLPPGHAAAGFEPNGSGEAWFAGNGPQQFSPNGVMFREGFADAGGTFSPIRHEWKTADYTPGVGHHSPPPIPEPETYALLLAGLGVLAIVRKRQWDRRGHA